MFILKCIFLIINCDKKKKKILAGKPNIYNKLKSIIRKIIYSRYLTMSLYEKQIRVRYVHATIKLDVVNL